MKSNTAIATLLKEAAATSVRAARLATAGKIDDALRLENNAALLREKAKKFAAVLQSEPTASARQRVEMGDVVEGRARKERGESARAVAIAALSEISVPYSPRSLAQYAYARFGTRIDHRSFASMRRDEARAWALPRAARAVYLVPALEGRLFLPIRGKVALSSWPLDRRIIGPWSERADHLRATVEIAKQFQWVARVEPEVAGRMLSILHTHASTVPGAISVDDSIDLDRVRAAAEAELAVVGESDEKWRKDAAERAQRVLGDKQRLWGTEPPDFVPLRA